MTYRFCLLVLLVAGGAGSTALAACVGRSGSGAEEDPVDEVPIEVVLERHTSELMAIPGVVGTGQGLCHDRPCIRVYIVERSRELERRIPRELGGYKVETVVTGRIEAGPEPAGGP